jgi:hypothetical protein
VVVTSHPASAEVGSASYPYLLPTEIRLFQGVIRKKGPLEVLAWGQEAFPEPASVCQVSRGHQSSEAVSVRAREMISVSSFSVAEQGVASASILESQQGPQARSSGQVCCNCEREPCLGPKVHPPYGRPALESHMKLFWIQIDGGRLEPQPFPPTAGSAVGQGALPQKDHRDPQVQC